MTVQIGALVLVPELVLVHPVHETKGSLPELAGAVSVTIVPEL
jgi:hypothetical protein